MAGFTGANGQSYTTAADAAASINRANASTAIAQPKAPTVTTPAPAPALQTAPKAPATPNQAVSNANSTVAQPVTNPTAQNAINVSKLPQGQTTPGAAPITQSQMTQPGGAATTTQATTQTALQPWQKSDYSTNLSYVPTDTTDPVFSQVTDPYTRAILTANMTNATGKTNIDTSTMPKSAEDEAEMTVSQNEEKQTYMDTQIDQSIQNSRTATAQSQGAVNATIGNVNREGATSTGNTQTAQQIVSKYGTDQANLEAQYNQQKLELANATQNNDTAAMKSLSEGIAATQQQLLTTANSQLTDAKNLVDSLSKSGGLTGMSDTDLMDMSQQYGISFPVLKAMATQANVAAQTQTQKDQATATTSAIDTFVKLNTAGVQITPDMVQSTAKQMGVDPTLLQGAASGFNQQVANINADKTLDTQTKQTALAKAQSDLQDQLNGFAGKAGQDIKGLVNLYNSGASADVISAYKQAAGITDYNDPMTQAKLAMQNAQTDDERAKAYTDAVDAGLNPGAVIPTGGTYSMTVDASGKCQVDPPDGTYLGPGASNECGGYVNQVFGAKVMPSSYEGKLATCDKSVGFGAGQTPPTPGMAFVMNVPGSSYGHTGIFLGVDPNKPGMATVKDSNYNDKTEPNVVQTHDIPLSEIKGYTPPPNSIDQTSGTGQIIGLAQIQSISATALQKGLEDGSIDINKLSTSAFAHVKDVLGADTMKSIQDTAANNPQALVKSGQMTQTALDTAAKSILDGKASPDQYGRMGPQILARAQQLDTSGTFSPEQVQADWEAVKGNAADYAKVEAMSKSVSTLFDTLATQQKAAIESIEPQPGISPAPFVLGAYRGLAEGVGGSTAFKTPEATMAELKGQIASIAATGATPHDATLKSLTDSLNLNQTPEQFQASLAGIKQAIDAKSASLQAAQNPGKTYGTYDGQGGSTSTSSTGIGAKIQQATSAGHSSQDIITYLSSDATYGAQVQAAISHGYSPDEIIAYLQNK